MTQVKNLDHAETVREAIGDDPEALAALDRILTRIEYMKTAWGGETDELTALRAKWRGGLISAETLVDESDAVSKRYGEMVFPWFEAIPPRLSVV
jgi:hypothetical protein